MKSTIKNIEEKLEKRRLEDINFELFGADSHLYKIRKVAEEDIVLFEEEFQIRLPDSFRLFLKEIGSGAGPKYGILSLDEIRETINGWKGYNELKVNLSKPFKYTIDDVEQYQVLNNYRFEETLYLKIPGGIYGWIPVSYHGCGGYSVLILNGEFKNKIWGLRAYDFELVPESYDFLKWYDNWLGNGQYLAEPLKVKNQFHIPRTKPETVTPGQTFTLQNKSSNSNQKNIIQLNSSNNQISELPDSLGDFSNLTELWLNSNELKTLPESISKLKKVKLMDISGNKGIDLSHLKNLESLVSLSIADCDLVEFPESITCLKNLEVLNLAGNHFTDIPETLSKYNKLKLLYLNSFYHNFTDMEAVFQTLSKLPKLKIVETTFPISSEFPDCIEEMKSLDYIYIQFFWSSDEAIDREKMCKNHLEKLSSLLPDTFIEFD